MTSRERFLAAVNHQEPDRVPQLVRWGKEAGEKLAKIFGVCGPDLGVRIGNDAIVCQLGINSEMEMSIGELEQGDLSKW
jgi:hypothetical protein